MLSHCKLTVLFYFILGSSCLKAQESLTYCNPINIDYSYTPIPRAIRWGNHRATADPVIVNYQGDYYLFSTNQWGYWHSPDLLNWNFVHRKFLRPWNAGYDELCAPAVGIIGDTMLVFGSTYTRQFSIWMSTNPKANEWKPLVDSFDIGGWDPAFFTDDDGRLYMYNGSSNRWPIYGVELNRKTLQPIGTRKELYSLESWRYGWHRFGEHLDDTFLDGFIEGAWMTKHNGKYYLQFGAPGTEFSWYADGALVGDSPLGYFQPQPDPMSAKPGGFARGAGHGATFQDHRNNYWHVSTIALSVKNNFERRIGLWPAGFDEEGVMYCNTSFGDYPHYLPAGIADHRTSKFTGWMLLNYAKPVMVSSSLPGHPANHAVDEDIRTYWSARTASADEWIETDLGAICTVEAIQINYADQNVDSGFAGKPINAFHQYKLFYSADRISWKVLIDKSNNLRDVPHDYVDLQEPVQARYLRLENIHVPTGLFAISGLRVFGKGAGAPPPAVKEFLSLRTEKDPRSTWLKWSPVDEAYAYNIYYGTNPDKLYTCITVYDANEYWLKSLDRESIYYFRIEAFNENGISSRSQVLTSQ
jgi:hypothetical protein